MLFFNCSYSYSYLYCPYCSKCSYCFIRIPVSASEPRCSIIFVHVIGQTFVSTHVYFDNTIQFNTVVVLQTLHVITKSVPSMNIAYHIRQPIYKLHSLQSVSESRHCMHACALFVQLHCWLEYSYAASL